MSTTVATSIKWGNHISMQSSHWLSLLYEVIHEIQELVPILLRKLQPNSKFHEIVLAIDYTKTNDILHIQKVA